MSIDRAAVAVTVLVWIGAGSCNLGEERADSLQREGIALVEARELERGEELLRAAYALHLEDGSAEGASTDARWIMRRHALASEFRTALEWGDRAYGHAESSGDDALIGRALVGLLEALQFIDDSAASNELIRLAGHYVPADDVASRASLRIAAAVEARVEGRTSDARALQLEALDLAREVGDLRLVQSTYINLADLAVGGGDLDQAEAHLRDARSVWRQRGVAASPGLLINEAALARARGDLPRSMALLQELTEGASPDVLWRIHRDRGLTHQAAGRLGEAEQSYRLAMNVVEEIRARPAPVQDMGEFFERRWSPFQLLFALQIERHDARGALETLLAAQGRMFLDAMVRSIPAPAVGSKVGTAVGEAIRRIDRLDQLVPALAQSALARTGQVDFVDFVLDAIRDRYVLSYFVGDGRLRLVVVEDGEPRIASTDIAVSELEELVKRFRGDPEDVGVAADLGAALMPADALPMTPRRIHVVPMGPILRLPLVALVVNGRRMIDSYEVASAPSITSLAVDRRAAAPPRGPAVVIADRRLDVSADDREVKAVMQATGARAYLGRHATTATFRGAALAPALHLIAHSGVNDREGYLVLDDDEEVTAADILAWGIRPRLVVLPTCASATTRRSEMWGSLVTAFLAAGSEHVVATLTSVPDDDAAVFAEAFYRHGGAVDPVAAVAGAQREMSRTRPVAEWSPYIVAGP